MLLVKPATVSRGFSDVITEEREHLTNETQTDTRRFLSVTL